MGAKSMSILITKDNKYKLIANININISLKIYRNQ